MARGDRTKDQHAEIARRFATNSLDLQVLYVAITDGVIAPISAVCVLANP